jgi:DNA polymerase I
MDSKKLMIIDGNSILNRAFYGIQGSELLSTSDGLYTNAVYGFINILYKYLEEEKPDYLSVAFDLKAPTFRHKEYDGYKAKRKGMPEELSVQVPVLKEVLDAMNIRRMEYEGYEADDIIGTMSLWGEERDMEVVIVTGDRDSLQLASKKTRIKLPTTRGGKTQTDEYDDIKVTERYGVTPTEFIDVKGLMGDSSDNIPGVPGIGEKTAVVLIQQYGSIEGVYEHLDDIEKKGVKSKLEANKDLAFLSKRLATIERKIPEFWNIDELKVEEFNQDKLYELFKRLEFKSFIDKFKLQKEDKPQTMQYNEVECINNNEKLIALKEQIKAARVFSVVFLLDKVENFVNKLTGISFCYEENKTSYVSLNECIDEMELLNIFKDVFEDESIKKYGHDLKSTFVFLKNRGIELKGVAFDTLIAAYLINPSRDTYTVAELASEYLHIGITPIEGLSGKGKSFTHFKDMDIKEISSVAGMHSETIYKLKSALTALLEENNQHSLYCDVELPLVEVLANMEYWGFKVNPEGLINFSTELNEKISLLMDEIYEMAGEKFNINSTKQLGVILFEKLNLPVIKKTKTGYSTDAEVLDKLSPEHEIVSKILEYRQLVKLNSTYAEGLLNVINPATGRIHSSFKQTVTTTGRISSTEPNLQNIPIKLEMGRKIRKVFVPENESFTLLDADYSQIELRVLAHITNDENMISAFKDNEDIHTSTAAKINGVSIDQVTPLMRSRAKTVNFGIVYGIGDFSLSRDLGITRKEARKYIDEYLDKYPNVKKYMHEIVESGKLNGYVTTIFNRRRYLPELKSSNFNMRSFGERIAMNTPIQGSAADIIKVAMVRVFRELNNQNLKSRLILQVHDELIIETLKEEKELVGQILKESMENAVKLNVPLSVDVKSGDSWYETK